MENIVTKDERVRKTSLFSRLLARPELGSIGGAILVLASFYLTVGDEGMFSSLGIVNFLELSAQLAIISCAAALLMIGGEFDLSIGSIIGFVGVVLAIFIEVLGMPIYAAIIFALIIAVIIGFINGWLVVTTKLPSFIVTLAMLFILRGLALVVIRTFSGRTQSYIDRALIEGSSVSWLFSGKALRGFFIWLGENGWVEVRDDGLPLMQGIPASIIWAIGLVIFVAWVLNYTKFGNWIFASGGDATSARNMGVPVDRVKIMLFVNTAVCAALFAIIQVLSVASADALRGTLKEFEAIIAAVIGGCLLTGGYGSPVGAAIGALIFGTIQQGIYYTGIDTDWFKVFLGMMMLVAVIFNNILRRNATGGK